MILGCHDSSGLPLPYRPILKSIPITLRDLRAVDALNIFGYRVSYHRIHTNRLLYS